MNLRLYLLKKKFGRSLENSKTEVLFVVIDSDKSKKYPLNFVCMFPLSHGLCRGRSAFRKLFGEESVILAKKLLSKALRKENDPEIKIEIRKRMKHLDLKTVQSNLPTLLESF